MRRPRLRVLHVVESFAAGTYGVAQQLASGLAEAGHATAVAYRLLPETPLPVADRFPDSVELIELDWRGRSPVSVAKAAIQLRHVARDFRPNVIHLHSTFAGIAGALSVAGRAATVYTPHGTAVMRRPEGSAMRKLEALGERLIVARVTEVGAVSEEEARLLREETGASRVVVIPNGVPELDDPIVRTAAPSDDDRPLVVSMGRIAPQRQPEATARILGSVGEIADLLWIGGADPRAETPIPAIPRTGWIEREEAVAELSRAAVLVHWSAWDGHPLAVLEAMARDVLVIGSDIPVNRELLGAAQVRGTEAEAGSLLRAVLTDRSTWERLIASQRQRRLRFSARRMVGAWIDAYSRLAGVESQPPPEQENRDAG